MAVCHLKHDTKFSADHTKFFAGPAGRHSLRQVAVTGDPIQNINHHSREPHPIVQQVQTSNSTSSSGSFTPTSVQHQVPEKAMLDNRAPIYLPHSRDGSGLSTICSFGVCVAVLGSCGLAAWVQPMICGNTYYKKATLDQDQPRILVCFNN